ncbi:SRPBCC domain-containing protein [Candidatus Micrarchaeota archaeon]|nr:SRPBCC domain-containing protein [Candidatus Micrarchaeota archaeon]
MTNDLVINRTFNAPVEKVWNAWADPVELRKWWGPKAFTSPFCKTEFHVGGKYLWCMRAPDGKDYWSTGIYKEIVSMKKIVYTDSFADAKGNRVPASSYGIEGEFPEELTVTVTFEEVNGKTKMTLKHAGMPAGEMSKMANAGWNESFDKMVESLKGE